MLNDPSQAPLTLMRIIRPARFAGTRFAQLRFASLALLALSGCSTATYPSLARRAAETRAEPASAPHPAHTAHTPSAIDQQRDSAVAVRLATLWADAAAADAQFKAHTARTAAALNAAAGSRPGTEGWSTANITLGELERDRGALGRALAEVEQIYTDDRLNHTADDAPDAVPRPLPGRIAQARESVEAMATAQDTILARLRAQLG